MAESSGPPDLLAIGHVTRDLVADRVVPGGAVTYGSLTARALGLTAAIVTSARPGDLEHTPGVDAHVVPSSATTTFRNLYRAGRRVQTIEAVAGPIAPDDVPAAWRDAPHVLIGPLAGEIDPAIARLLPRLRSSRLHTGLAAPLGLRPRRQAPGHGTAATSCPTSTLP